MRTAWSKTLGKRIAGRISWIFLGIWLPQSLAAEPAIEALDGAGAAVVLERALVDAIERCEKSVVAIARVRKVDSPGTEELSTLLPSTLAPGLLRDTSPLSPEFVPNDYASGVVIDSAGLVLTTYHVLGDLQKSDFYVWSQRRPFRATVISADPWYDLAVLRIDVKDLSPITFGDAQQVRKGQLVVALGNPQAIARDGEASASWGIVSNLLRRAPLLPDRSSDTGARDTLHHYGTLIQTDARLNFGYSGGALVNLRGEMIGLTTSYTAGADFEGAAGFAIPVDEQFVRTVEVMKAGGRPTFGFLGVGPQSLPEEQRRQGIHGALILSVVEGTPAARAGVHAGDVITHINHEPVYSDTDLFRVVGALPAGATATLTIFRGDSAQRTGDTLERQVTLSKKYVNAARPPVGTESARTWRGMSVDDSSASPSFAYLGPHLDPRGCVYVASVEPESPGWKAGLRPGLYVSQAGGRPVANPAEFFAAVEGRTGPVELVVLSGQGAPTRQTVSP